MELDYVGEVLYKGSGIRRFSHQQLRSEIVWVKQKPFLFANSIRENLSLDKKFTDDELWHAIELAGLSSDFSFFPDKLDTQIGEWGINLSGGQKQRIGLARALLRKGELYIFDDCLSAVDTVTENKILSSLEKQFLSDKTVLWTAHRESTLRNCDKIIHLRGHYS